MTTTSQQCQAQPHRILSVPPNRNLAVEKQRTRGALQDSNGFHLFFLFGFARWRWKGMPTFAAIAMQIDHPIALNGKEHNTQINV